MLPLVLQEVLYRPEQIRPKPSLPRIRHPQAAACQHSGKELLRELAGVSPRRASVPMYSTVDAALSDGQSFDAAYWVRNLREPVRFARAIDELLNDPARRRQMGDAGYRRLTEELSWDVSRRALVSFYEKLLGGPAAPTTGSTRSHRVRDHV